ncbi:acyltransferase family protein [Xylophilus sp. Kf1]|nr:acyltransferase family protein [Xylophilus sp. Kf1]
MPPPVGHATGSNGPIGRPGGRRGAPHSRRFDDQYGWWRMAEVPDRLSALQVLRALAAALVIFGHAQDTYLAKVMVVDLPVSSYALGDLGVKLFFCISGFMMHGAGSRMPPGVASVAAFAWRRLVRVVPLYWAATLLYAGKLALQGQPPAPGDYLESLFFFAHGVAVIRPILGVGWTLNFEMFFYAVFAATLMFRRGRALWVAGCFAAMACLSWFGVTSQLAHPAASYLYLLTNICLVYFLLGMALGWMRLRLQSRIAAAGWSAGAALALAVGVIGAYGAWLAWPGGMPVASPWAGWHEGLIASVVSATVAACLLESGAAGAPPGRVMRLLGAAGDASYSSYLVHGFVMGPCARMLSWLGFTMPVGLFALSMVLVGSAVGMALHRAIEKPLLQRFARPPWRDRSRRPMLQPVNRPSHSGR